eukprot:536064_1
MSTIATSTSVIKQGWLEKKSKHLGVWRRRWVVLTTKQLNTYKTQDMTDIATETIQLSSVNSIESCNDTTLCIKGDTKYKLKANTNLDKQVWIDSIRACAQNCIAIPVTYKCNRNDQYNGNFELLTPYDLNYGYSINKLAEDKKIDYERESKAAG